MRLWFAFALVVLLGASPAPLATLRIQTIATDDATPILYAQRSGMFAKATLRLCVIAPLR